MERRRRFATGVLAAALTFGSLTAFVGHHRLNEFKAQHFAHHGKCGWQDNNQCTHGSQNGNVSNNPTIDSLNH